MKDSDDAVVGVIVTVLIIGLFLVILVMINNLYVPQWLESSEAAHMDEVTKDFTMLKYAFDVQSMVSEKTAITTPVTLGTREIPFFENGRTFDTLEIINDEVIITIECFEAQGREFKSDAIVFSSGNSFFVDQSIIYEAGALIISQDGRDVVYGNPTLITHDYISYNNSWPDLDRANVTFSIPQIFGLPGKTNAGGFGVCPIYAQLNSTENLKFPHVKSVTVNTTYINAWESILKEGIEPEAWLDYEITKTTKGVTLEFQNESRVYDFYIYAKDITTQIAFGLAD